MARSSGNYAQMTPNQERLQLYHKGTRPWTLSPENIVQAAVRDIESKLYNAALKSQREELPVRSQERKLLGAAKQYAFIPQHVSKAKTASTLLQLAIEDRGPGLMSLTLNTVMIYDDEDRLKAALKLSLAHEEPVA